MNRVEVIKTNLETEKDNNLVINNEKKNVAGYGRVSTLYDEQVTSFESQVSYYTKKIKSNSGWRFVGFYGDRGISGTRAETRPEFTRMINDAISGKIDIIIAKSISRFARNTMDTLQYIRLLREHNVDVYFEKENIHTLHMDSEMFLTFYSAFAQAESESISQNVKIGLKSRMKEGKWFGNPTCYGYKWNKITKDLEIDEEQAKIVRQMFEYYSDGKGCHLIANKLNEQGITSPTGKKWHYSSICRMIQNEKYVGDYLVQKNYILDPISHKKVRNFGEKEMYYVKDHHTPIITREVWNKAVAIHEKRSNPRKQGHLDYNKFSRLYTFSSKIQCGCCGKSYVRKKNTHGNLVPYWVCTSRLSGYEEKSKSIYIREDMLKEAFVKIYNLYAHKKKSQRASLYNKLQKLLLSNDSEKEIRKLNEEQNRLRDRLSKLLDMKLDDYANKDVYESKEKELNDQINAIDQRIDESNKVKKKNNDLKKHLEKIEEIISSNHQMKDFDEDIFEILVEKIIIGGEDESGNYSPNIIRFMLRVEEEIDYLIGEDKSLQLASNGSTKK